MPPRHQHPWAPGDETWPYDPPRAGAQQVVSQQEAPQQEAPHNGVAPNGVPQQGVPQQGVPQQGVPQQGVPQQGVPQQGFPPDAGTPLHDPHEHGVPPGPPRASLYGSHQHGSVAYEATQHHHDRQHHEPQRYDAAPYGQPAQHYEPVAQRPPHPAREHGPYEHGPYEQGQREHGPYEHGPYEHGKRERGPYGHSQHEQAQHGRVPHGKYEHGPSEPWQHGSSRPGPATAHSGGRGHSHGTTIAVSRHTSRVVTFILVPCAVLTAIALVVLWPGRVHPTAKPTTGTEQRAYGNVLSVTQGQCPDTQTQSVGGNQPCGVASVQVTDGPGKGKTVVVDLPRGPGAPTLAVGDAVVLAFYPDAPNGSPQFAVTDHQRGKPMLLMVALCALVIVAFGRLRGVAALIALGASFAVLLFFVIPAILNGSSSLLVAIVGSSAVMFTVLYLTHGVNVHTSVAVLGTLASLILTGLLGAAFTATTALTGFGSEETLYLSILNQDVDMRGLLLAGIIIGALGVLDDVTVTQASTVAELARTATSRIELYRSAARVGRDHVASAVNTIIMAYAGASLPLLLLLTAGGRDASDLLTSEFLAQEIVRSAVGTIGLVASVPITTGLAALVADLRHTTETVRRRD